MGCGGLLMGMLQCGDWNEKRSLEARSNSFTILFFLLVSPACPPPPFSPPQCCPLLTILKATGPIQILYNLEYYSLWDSRRKWGGFTCLSTVSSGWGYVFFLCMHPEYKEGESDYSVCLYCTCQCYQLKKESCKHFNWKVVSLEICVYC